MIKQVKRAEVIFSRNALLDQNNKYVVGAGVNTRDYEERIPALVESGADVLCIDSSEGFTQ